MLLRLSRQLVGFCSDTVKVPSSSKRAHMWPGLGKCFTRPPGLRCPQ